MSEWLLLRIPRDPTQAPAWIITDARGQLLAAPGQSAGSELTAAAHGRRVALVVSGADVLQLVAPLPQGNETRLQQLAPSRSKTRFPKTSMPCTSRSVRAMGEGTAPCWWSPQIARRMARAGARVAPAPEAIHADSDLAPVLPGHLAITVDGDHLVLRREGEVRPCCLPRIPGRAGNAAGRGCGDGDAACGGVCGADGWRQHAAAFEALRPISHR